MERFYLEKPSLERKEEAMEYIDEFKKSKSKINGTGGLDGTKAYEEWLEEALKCEEKEYAESKGIVPATTYFTIRESDNKIIGMINIRHYLNEYLANFGGHIGYGIRPTERRKGYAKIQLYMALKETNKMDLDKVMISCEVTNIGSEKTMLSLGSILEKIVHDEERNRYLKIHWIDVEKSLEKYKDVYGKYIIENNIKRK